MAHGAMVKENMGLNLKRMISCKMIMYFNILHCPSKILKVVQRTAITLKTLVDMHLVEL